MKPAILAAALALAGCAASPESIQPVSMGTAYSGISCERAAVERNAAAQALAAFETEQRGAQTGDAIGVLLTGIPMSSLLGQEVAGEIATEKGKIVSLDARLLECSEVASYDR